MPPLGLHSSAPAFIKALCIVQLSMEIIKFKLLGKQQVKQLIDSEEESFVEKRHPITQPLLSTFLQDCLRDSESMVPQFNQVIFPL